MSFWKKDEGKPEVTPTEDPQGGRHQLASGHRVYSTMVNADGDTVRNWSNWGACPCPMTDDHDG